MSDDTMQLLEYIKKYTHSLDTIQTVNEKTNSLQEGEHRSFHFIAAIMNVDPFMTKKGNMMARITLEDLTGEITVLAFSNRYDVFRRLMHEGVIAYFRCNAYRKQGSEPCIAVEFLCDYRVIAFTLDVLTTDDQSEMEHVINIFKKSGEGNVTVRLCRWDPNKEKVGVWHKGQYKISKSTFDEVVKAVGGEQGKVVGKFVKPIEIGYGAYLGFNDENAGLGL